MFHWYSSVIQVCCHFISIQVFIFMALSVSSILLNSVQFQLDQTGHYRILEHALFRLYRTKSREGMTCVCSVIILIWKFNPFMHNGPLSESCQCRPRSAATKCMSDQGVHFLPLNLV